MSARLAISDTPWWSILGGEIVGEAGESETLLEVEIDLGLVEAVRSKLTALADRRTDLF